MSGLDEWLGMRGGAPRPQMQGAQEGRITRANHVDGAWFIIPEYSTQLEFGPAPWCKSRVEPETEHVHGETGEGGGVTAPTSHDHKETVPPPGARCLVIFVGTGIERPWVVGWWP